MKMDHHCPWINNCVGHFNHGHFVAFLTFAVLGCAQASFVLAMTLYYGLNRVSVLTAQNPVSDSLCVEEELQSDHLLF